MNQEDNNKKSLLQKLIDKIAEIFYIKIKKKCKRKKT